MTYFKDKFHKKTTLFLLQRYITARVKVHDFGQTNLEIAEPVCPNRYIIAFQLFDL